MEEDGVEKGIRGKVEELSERENWRDKRKIATAVFFLSTAVFVGAVAFRGSIGFGNLTDTGLADDGPGQELTKYQEVYVDCPVRYLELCTDMSKIPTEPVEFQKAENGRLYLALPRSNRTLVANIQGEGDRGYLVHIRE